MRRRKQKSLFKEKFMVIFIAGIMILSVIGYMWGRDSTEKFDYNDFTFVRKDNGWLININNKNIVFNYFPTEVEHINLSSEIINKIAGKIEVDTTCDINDSHAEVIASVQYNIDKVFNDFFSTYLRQGFTSENMYNFPVIKCEDATELIPVAYFKSSNTTQIHLEDNCIIFEADSNADFIMLKDRLLYGLFGIIK